MKAAHLGSLQGTVEKHKCNDDIFGNNSAQRLWFEIPLLKEGLNGVNRQPSNG